MITERGVNKYSEIVDARIRGTLRTPMRMWNLDVYSAAIESLVGQYKAAETFPPPDKGRFHTAWEIARPRTFLPVPGIIQLRAFRKDPLVRNTVVPGQHLKMKSPDSFT